MPRSERLELYTFGKILIDMIDGLMEIYKGSGTIQCASGTILKQPGIASHNDEGHYGGESGHYLLSSVTPR